MKQTLLLVLVLALFGAAVYGLISLDAGAPEPDSDARQAPPVDHIDDASRDALREILREEGGE